MAKLRNKTQASFTMVANTILRDKRLTLKDRGLLITILSLPDNWDFSVAGLCMILEDGKASIKTSVSHLEELGYLARIQSRDSNGKFSGYDWEVYEEPVLPLAENRSTGKPSTENPSTENQPQLNTKELNNITIKKEKESVEKLTDEEYEKLCKEYSKADVDYHIERIKNNGYKGCLNFETIKQWLEERKCRKTIPKPTTNGFNDFQQRSYDYRELEKILVAN